jgi:hypothetical protein
LLCEEDSFQSVWSYIYIYIYIYIWSPIKAICFTRKRFSLKIFVSIIKIVSDFSIYFGLT